MTGNNFRFKVHGIDNLMSIQELIRHEAVVKHCMIKIIDVRAKEAWVADYPTVKRKFR